MPVSIIVSSLALCRKRADAGSARRLTQTDSTGQWRMVCGRCWRNVSGGVADGDSQHPHYRYGGLWKNRTVKRLAADELAAEKLLSSH
jgi:hypothetical protein